MLAIGSSGQNDLIKRVIPKWLPMNHTSNKNELRQRKVEVTQNEKCRFIHINNDISHDNK